MKNILIGNGVTIQHGGSSYTNKNIVLRVVENARLGHYEDNMKKTLSPEEAYEFFKLFEKEVKLVLKGKYMKFARTQNEKSALNNFMIRYPKVNTNFYDVGFEDFFLILSLLFNKFEIDKETRTDVYTAFKRFLLDSIYNEGKINELHTFFPEKFKGYLDSFSSIFTTNYDLNIEKVCNKDKIYHLHGQFDKLQSVYDYNSLRNKASDLPATKFDIPEDYAHTYCNAIMDFTKTFQVSMYSDANAALDKLVAGYKEGILDIDEIESWNNNTSMKKIYDIFMHKVNNPGDGFDEFPLKKLDIIKGDFFILGLSPNNDSHILDRVKNNKEIKSITYYYFNTFEADNIKKLFKDSDKKIILEDAKLFWKDMS